MSARWRRFLRETVRATLMLQAVQTARRQFILAGREKCHNLAMVLPFVSEGKKRAGQARSLNGDWVADCEFRPYFPSCSNNGRCR